MVHMGHSTGPGGGSHVAVAAVDDGADDAVDFEEGGSVGVDGSSLEPVDCCTHFDAGDAARTSYQTFGMSSYETFRGHVDSAVVGTSWYRTSLAEGQHRKYRRRQPHAGRTTAVEEHTLAGRIADLGGLTWCLTQRCCCESCRCVVCNYCGLAEAQRSN